MPLLKQFKLLASYNQLMNQRLYAAVATLPETKVKEDAGAFFKSLLGTLNHILVGDILWLQRFSNHSASQKSLEYFLSIETPSTLNELIFTDFNDLSNERKKIDQLMINWIESLREKDLDATIYYKNMNGINFEKNYASLINHLFLHQVHHRGQATTLLTQFGVDFGDTDLIEII